MRAILPGRPQSKRQALCTAHWDGLRLVAYISGNAAVILSGPQTIVQTIYVDTVEALTAITLEETTGRIALGDTRHVYIYEPVGRAQGVLRWVQIHDLPNPPELDVASLSWGSPGELLLGGSRLVLWFLPDTTPPEITWNQELAYPTLLAYFSPDAAFIASIGAHDRLVKVWRRLSYEVEGTRFDVCYLPHPAAATNLHWRKPWHREQNLDNLLYTFCSDSRVRAWTTFDPHAVSLLQPIGAIDMNASIQPRRLSANSMSTRRFAFIIDSRDFAIATEKAVLGSSPKQADHALEHLIEIANRTPEICVVLDGLGHMSVWGWENAGYKNRIPPAVFHISHVDGMDIHVPQIHDPLDDYLLFCVFAGGATPSSLSLLLHSFAGDIDWYDSPITHLFDTGLRPDRVRLISSLAGHGSPIQKVVRNVVGTVILSTTEEGHASLWQHGANQSTAPLLRRSSFAVGADILDAVILSQGRYAAILTSRGLELWDVRSAKATRLAVQAFEQAPPPQRITQSRIAGDRALTSRVLIGHYADRSAAAWELLLPADNGRKYPPGYHEIIRPLGEVKLHVRNRFKSVIAICDNMSTDARPWERRDINSLGFTAILAKDGLIESVSAQEETDEVKPYLASGPSFETNVQRPFMISANGYGKVIVVNHDRTSLSIWDVRTGACEYEHDLDGTDTVHTCAWAISPRGAALVAVGFDFHIVVLSQIRYSYPNLEPAWLDLQHIRIRDYTTHSIGDLCWLRCGDLVVGTGIQFFIFKGYARTHHNETAKPLTVLARSGTPDSTFDIMAVLNAVLPVFHPTLLSVLTAWKGVAAVKQIMARLYRVMKFFSDGDRLPSFLDLPLESIGLEAAPQQKRVSQYGPNAGVNGDSETPPLVDMAASLCDHLNRHELWQLSHEDETRLVRQVEVSCELEKQECSLDLNAQRFLQALYASGDDGVPWSAIHFASLSASQEVLVDLVTRFYGGKLTWEAARRSGLFCWLSDVESLRQQMENVGRAEFTKHEDRNPVDCSLFYLALGKKSVLQGLWRTAVGVREKENTMKLLGRNFTEPRWKSTALKNAYALLSKRRFHYGAAFFLLGGSLWDAVNVCVHQLQDFQLAIAIARVFGSPQGAEALTRLLKERFLPLSVESHQGRWMASWAYSLLGQPDLAIQPLVRPVHQVVGRSLSGIPGTVGSLSYAANDPVLAVIYQQLRARLVKQNAWHNLISPQDEWAFVMRCVRQLLRMGCDVLALDLVRTWEFVPVQPDPAATGPGDGGMPMPLQRRKTVFDLEREEEEEEEKMLKRHGTMALSEEKKTKPPPTQFQEPSANSLLDSFGF